MIRDISIQNFRCFENTSISGFKTVNLITGKNNAGKTALLEALLLANVPQLETIIALKRYRRESPERDRILPTATWSNFSFNQDISKNILIEISNDNNHSSKITISIFNNPIQLFEEINESSEYPDLLANNESSKSLLNLNIVIDGEDSFKASLVATNKGIANKVYKLPAKKNISFIQAYSISSNAELVFQYDKIRLKNQEQEVLKGFQIIDSSISSVESFVVGTPMIYLQTKDMKRLPLSLFGDATNKMANILFSILNNDSGVLLIDEIENGIHYANQANLWRMLFRLAKELNVQIFATAHSLEMLKSFTEVGLESEFSDLAAHFEMARSVKTGDIIGIKRDIDTLSYSLSHNRRVRGE